MRDLAVRILLLWLVAVAAAQETKDRFLRQNTSNSLSRRLKSYSKSKNKGKGRAKKKEDAGGMKGGKGKKKKGGNKNGKKKGKGKGKDSKKARGDNISKKNKKQGKGGKGKVDKKKPPKSNNDGGYESHEEHPQPFPPVVGDMGLRFNKIVFPDGIPDNGHLPLGPEDYPISKKTAAWLQESQVHSLVIDDNCFKCPMRIATLVELIGGPPTHPSSDADSAFWEELKHVVWVQEQRRQDVNPGTLMPLPTLWKDYDCQDVTDAVHNEMPGTNHVPLLEQFMSEGAAVDTTIVQPYSRAAFLRNVVLLADVNTWAAAMVGPMNFGVKYFGGRVRPEEVVYKIKTGEITASDGVPEELVAMVTDMPFETPEEFTAYPEGCPPHPSWPAMHSAASSASLWMAVLMDLTPEQECQARLMDYAVAYARTIAGVHYKSDNWAGLTIGQELIAQYLPQYLADLYGSDPEAVKAKVEEKRFDWTDFESSPCAQFGTVAADDGAQQSEP